MEPNAVSGDSPYRQFSDTPGSTHNLVVSLVPPGARVLELGCASGYMSSVLKERLGCSVTAIEVSAEAAERAREHCARVVVGDAEALDLERLFGPAAFDAIVAADVLEHLRDPARVLQRLRPLLASGGAVVASVPNVAHGSVRLALLGGEFRYRDAGLLDRTHLRFLTRETLQDLFETAGYAFTHWLRRRVSLEESEVDPPLRAVPAAIRAWIAQDPEATTYQFVVRAVPSDAGPAIHRRRAELRAARRARQWRERARQVGRELAAVVPPEAPVILVDEDRIRPELEPTLRIVPFPERDGHYAGPPTDDATAIREVERLRRDGAAFLAVAWPAFWWLEFYGDLARHLAARYRRVLEAEGLAVFDLRGGGTGETAQSTARS